MITEALVYCVHMALYTVCSLRGPPGQQPTKELEDDIVGVDSSDPEDLFQTEKLTLISNGLPPIPNKLVQRIEEELFVEMAELLSSYLDSVDFNTGGQKTRSHKRLPVLRDITEWVQCFGMYITIISCHKPKPVADLMGYQMIIMEASLGSREGKWLTYDRCFHLKASASNLKQWATIGIAIWNTTFPERAIRSHQWPGPSSYYQSRQYPPQRSRPLYHQSNPPSQGSKRQNQAPPTTQSMCLNWNENPNGCSRVSCRYAHLCYKCIHNPGASDQNHKASQCPYRKQGK